MGRGSYRGGSTPVGWNANHYVAPALTGRTRKGKALIKDLTARTAQSREELAAQNERARKRHGLKAAHAKPATGGTAISSSGKSGMAGAARKRLKARAGQAFSVTVVRRRRRKS